MGDIIEHPEEKRPLLFYGPTIRQGVVRAEARRALPFYRRGGPLGNGWEFNYRKGPYYSMACGR